jgi:hypothetical protein
MADPATISSLRVVELIAARVRKRIACLEAVGLPGFAAVIHELKVVLDLLERGARYIAGNQR